MTIIDIANIKPINDRVYVTDLEFGEQTTKSGLIITDDDGQGRGIRPRWAKVIKSGPKQTELNIGDYILLSHGRWSRAIKVLIDNKETKMFMIDYPNGVLAISKSKPSELERVGK